MVSIMGGMSESWSAPRATSPITWAQHLPGSKSITNRAFIITALADSPSVLRRPLASRDTDLMAAALKAMGVGIDTHGAEVHVTPAPLHGAEIDCGLAGTVMRFIPPVAALADGPVTIDGDDQARQRPLKVMLDALRELGVEVEGDGLPATLSSPGVPAGREITIDASQSSQFVSGLLLSGARFTNGLTLRHEGGALPSLPHVEMTVGMLRAAGVTIDSDDTSWTVHPGPIKGGTWNIEPDLTNAAPFLAAAAVTGGRVTIKDYPASTRQPGDRFRHILMDMGATINQEPTFCTALGAAYGQLHGIDIDMSDIGELVPTVAALAALANSPTRIRGVAHLRGHETDRLNALATNLNSLGGDVTEEADGLTINPARLHGGTWQVYGDHRMVTAGAILGLRVEDVVVDDVAAVSKTIPGFDRMWQTMLDEGMQERNG